ncbi:MAG: hypothetical protein WB392_06990 [Methanotrichaceae archaeon]
MHPKLERLGTTGNVFLVGLAFAAIFFMVGIELFGDISFIRGIITSLFGASLSVALSVYFIPTIIKKDQEERSLRRSEEGNIELLKYLKEGRMQYIQQEARMATIGNIAKTKWDDEGLKEMVFAGRSLLEGIEHEKDILSIHSFNIKGYSHPVIESRKMEYLHHLRQLRDATRILMLPQYHNREEESRQFEIARGEALTARDSLSDALETALKGRTKSG